MTTGLIVINHVQNLALIGSMQLEWPELLTKIYAALRLDMLPYLHIECFVRESDGGTQQTVAWLSSYAGCLLLLIGLNLWWPIRCCVKPIEWSDDMIENDAPSKRDALAELEAAQRANADLALKKDPLRKRLARDLQVDEEEGAEFTIHIREGMEASRIKNTREAWDDFFSVVYSMFFTFALRYAIDLHLVMRKEPEGMRALGHVIAASLLCTVFGGVAFFWHHVREYKSADNDSRERLKLLQRVRYLTQRFTRNGKSWQFVVWGRQVSLTHSHFIQLAPSD